MRNIKLQIAFDGSAYHGWQLQPNAPTIQGEIEKRLAVMHNQSITLHGAGRTDAGVHATGMVAHFHTPKAITCTAFLQGLNSMLPGAIRILEATDTESSFHARFSAKGKRYIYALYNGNIMMPQERLYTLHVRAKLNIAAMQRCLDLLVGTHDFASFETAGSRNPNTPCERGSIRTITNATITHKRGGLFCFALTGDGFLRHMVRNIVGTALEVGVGRRSTESFHHALLAKKRSEAGTTAPAHGLTLEKVFY